MVEQLSSINWALFAPVIVLQIILQVVALVSLFRIEVEQVRGPKWLWAVVILLSGLIGPVLYFTVARRQF